MKDRAGAESFPQILALRESILTALTGLAKKGNTQVGQLEGLRLGDRSMKQKVTLVKTSFPALFQ